MDSLSTELRKAREERGMSLADIADATLINLRFLEDIDRGNLTFLPRTYVRAFVREYAAAVGVDPQHALQLFEQSTEPPTGPAAEPDVVAPSAAAPPSPPPATPGERRIDPAVARIAIIVIVILAVAVALWNILGSREPLTVKETPFDSIRREQEQKARPAAASHPSADSLVLSAFAVDSVWLKVAIDDSTTRQMTLKPRARVTWKAARRFVLALGNPAAVEFKLNGRNLEPLGPARKPVKDVEITRKGITRK